MSASFKSLRLSWTSPFLAHIRAKSNPPRDVLPRELPWRGARHALHFPESPRSIILLSHSIRLLTIRRPDRRQLYDEDHEGVT